MEFDNKKSLIKLRNSDKRVRKFLKYRIIDIFNFKSGLNVKRIDNNIWKYFISFKNIIKWAKFNFSIIYNKYKKN